MPTAAGASPVRVAASSESELEVLIRARFPLLSIVSWEEQRVEQMLSRLAQKQGKRLFIWTVTQGMVEPGQAAELVDLKNALTMAGRLAEPSIVVLKDAHRWLDPSIAAFDASVVRGLRDLAASFKSTYKTLILLSPVLAIPPELEKDMIVVDYDLPGAAELRGLIEEVIAASRSGERFPVQLSPAELEKLAQALQGMTLAEAESTLARAVVQNGKLDIGALDVVLKEIKQIVRKSRLLEYFEAKEAVSGIGGMPKLKEWLAKRGRAFSEQAREFGLPQPKGVLLLGVQGCGKSMMCKAISSLWKLPLLRLDMGSIFGGYIGQSEDNMRRAIKTAEAVAPCILWLDEIEKGLSGTASSNSSDAGTTARVFSTFLTWLQERTKPVFVAATANDISALPPELLRKGRLDEIFFVDLPSAAERQEILGIHLAARSRDPKAFPVAELAAQADGFSGAELEQAVVDALSEAFAAGRELSAQDVLAAIKSTVPLSTTMRDPIARLRQWASTRARPVS